MDIKVKLLNDKRYKSCDTFESAIDRWREKGWNLADVAQNIQMYGDDAVAILWKSVLKEERDMGSFESPSGVEEK